ncbi:hypothetical protein [Demequina sp. NBRC 110051]|uniref:hypothetical protein n=1 Tax=Demequina sp. NBRC 110051 TaxID=1570340 RepID=UPI000A032467|nr:hypothetical protein [Demequina sp. NBRC 110051]
MKYLRVIASAFLVLLGSMLIVAWALSLQAVKSIENGTAAEKLVTTTLEAPQTAEFVADQVQAALAEQVESQAGDIALVLLDDQIHGGLVAVLQSDAFLGTITTAGNAAQDRLLAAISDPDREPGPLAIDIDLGTRINTAIDQIPVVGAFIPDIEFPEYSVEIVDADTFEDVRSGYAAMEWVATWFVWIGVTLIAAGVAVAPRWRRFLPRALLAAGLFGIAVAFVLGSMGPRTIASFMPGGRDGGLGTLIEDVIGDTALAPVTNVLLTLGLVALGLALIWALVMRFVPGMAGRDDPAPVDAEEADAVVADEDDESSAEVTDTTEFESVPPTAATAVAQPTTDGAQPPSIQPTEERRPD